jgi:predicted pyridoxine 5'-phosphate oxidase superfamily flavin-nucleotide-binding protein
MSSIYGERHRTMQQMQDSERLADRLLEAIVCSEINQEHKEFIESRDMFFLSTVDHRGYPTCSHKGGAHGFVRVVDSKTLAFPSYDGNGMYLSMGNIAAAGKVGMLFIDFTTPHRVRVHGDATVSRSDPLLDTYYGAEWIVRVTIAEIFVNCARYIHRYERRESSKYVPEPDKATPFPQWKRIDVVQDALPTKDQGIAKATGGTITVEEYGSLLAKGES